ncbi:MAG: DNA adenine methylase [Cyclobacteriaceae bacterium]
MYRERRTPTTSNVNEPLGLFPNDVSIKPFLKWAGGKTQLLGELHKHVPKKYNKYIEPFIGGGAMFFSLNPNESIISDSNEELINTYQQIKENINSVIEHLKTFKHSEEYFLHKNSMKLRKTSG